MARLSNWIAQLEDAIQQALDKFLKEFETRSSTYNQNKSSFDKYAQTHTKQEIKSKFANNLLVLSAAVMKADGKVLKSELNYVKSFLNEQFSPGFAKVRILMLREVLKENYPPEKAAKLILECMPLGQRKFLLEYLFHVAKADGAIVPKEIAVIDKIARALGYYGVGYEQLKSKYVKIASKNEYAILGIKKDASDKEVKKAYRKMANKHHPDRFATRSIEEQKDAKKKFQQIQKAYETIKKERGIH